MVFYSFFVVQKNVHILGYNYSEDRERMVCGMKFELEQVNIFSDYNIFKTIFQKSSLWL